MSAEATAPREPQAFKWTHDAERSFILGLGGFVNETYLKNEPQGPERTLRLLHGYLDSIDMRENWPKGARVEVLREITRNKIKRVMAAIREARA